jgi:hypothetical protein
VQTLRQKSKNENDSSTDIIDHLDETSEETLKELKNMVGCYYFL